MAYVGTLAERFAMKVGQADQNGCLPWLGGTAPRGYGQLFTGTVGNVRAHRAAWELQHGPIPEGQLVHHRCRRKDCVNVDHLELMSASEHMHLHGAENAAGIVVELGW